MTPSRVGVALLGVTALVALLAPVLAPNPPDRQFRDFLLAPPMSVRVLDDGRLRAPFVYGLRLVDRLERRYEEDRSQPRSLRWFAEGQLVTVDGDDPLLLLGSDELGRDVFSRLIVGARASLGVAVTASLLALLVGGLWGTTAAAVGGWTDELLMRVADFVLVLPALYVVIVLRAVTPLVLSPSEVFAMMVVVFAVVGWPYVARGVRAIVVSEKEQPYYLGAVAVGLAPWTLIRRHLLPASYGFLAVQAVLLVPGFMLAEATLSFVGLGFTDPTTSWGVMLQEAADIRAIAEFPWQLTPALAIVAVVLAVNLTLSDRDRRAEGLVGSLALGPASRARSGM